MPRVTSTMTYEDAAAALTEADAALQSAKGKDEKRQAAMDFAAAHRDARLAAEKEQREAVQARMNGALG